MLAACGGEPPPATIDGHWRVFPKVLDDTCEIGFQSHLDVLDIAGDVVTASGRVTRLTADGDTWRSSARISNPQPCALRDGFETWEVRATPKGLSGTYEALFAAGGTCEPICLVRVSFTGIHRDDPVTARVAAPGPLGSWRPVALFSPSEVAAARGVSPETLRLPPGVVPPIGGMVGPLGRLPDGAPPIPEGPEGHAAPPFSPEIGGPPPQPPVPEGR